MGNGNVRTIDTHHDGHGLNESIVISSDVPDKSGAAHYYEFDMQGDAQSLHSAGSVRFQTGPRGEVGSTPGITEAALLAVLIDRLRGFQSGPYACRENAIQLTKLEEVLHWTKARADERAKRGVLGRNVK